MNVSAVLVTRGNVDIQPVLDSLPYGWEVIVWDNSVDPNLSVYGRYAAIEYASHEVIYVQDDDVIVSDPPAIVDALMKPISVESDGGGGTITRFDLHRVVCNMPQEFRHDGYTDSALVGFGAAFHRDAPERSFVTMHSAVTEGVIPAFDTDVFERTCDVVFTTLTDRVLVDVPKVNREFAEDPDRMYRQPDHVGERARMLALAREARDA